MLSLIRSKIVLNSRSYKKFARSLTLTCSQTNNNYKSKKTAFFQMCFFLFSYENVFHDVLLQFYLIHFSHYFLSSRSRSLAFHKDSYKKLLFDCVCVFLICVYVCVSVLFLFFGCVFVTCRVFAAVSNR